MDLGSLYLSLWNLWVDKPTGKQKDAAYAPLAGFDED